MLYFVSLQLRKAQKESENKKRRIFYIDVSNSHRDSIGRDMEPPMDLFIRIIRRVSESDRPVTVSR